MAVAEPPATVSRLPLLIMGAVVLLTVLVTIALLAVGGPKTYQPGTPEAAVQDFVQAAFDNDMPTLLSMLSDESIVSCEVEADRRKFDDKIYSDGLRAELEEMNVTGDIATAEVRFRQDSSSGPFANSTWSYEERFELIRVEGDWLIERASWPYQIADCTRGRR